MNKTQDMPEWLKTTENYIPKPDRDLFIDRSILSLMKAISRIKAQDSVKLSRYSPNAALKVVFTFILVLLLSLSRSFVFVMTVDVYLLVVLSLMNGKDIARILKTSLSMTLFTFIILLPAAFYGGRFNCIMITSKVFGSITAVNILSRTTRWSAITAALKRFFVPDIFILVFDITIKYIAMLGDFTLNMLYALKLRSVGKNRRKYTSISGAAGTMFIKSKEMAGDMYSAMECRGFTGEYHVHERFKFSAADAVYTALNAGIMLLFFYFGRF